MKNLSLALMIFFASSVCFSQKAADLFLSNDVKVSWLGVDFSHAKFIGDFSQAFGIGKVSPSKMKNDYFPAWNRLILDEREKYDIGVMVKKSNIFYDIDMIMSLNSKTPTEDIESYNNPNYPSEDVAKFVERYNVEAKKGIGLVFLVESINKAEKEATMWFLAITMPQKEILVQERLVGNPSGMGVKNYWAGSFRNVIQQIRESKFDSWKSKYKEQ
jgi:hypothetical protein